jgi:hypothetical protein
MEHHFEGWNKRPIAAERKFFASLSQGEREGDKSTSFQRIVKAGAASDNRAAAALRA